MYSAIKPLLQLREDRFIVGNKNIVSNCKTVTKNLQELIYQMLLPDCFHLAQVNKHWRSSLAVWRDLTINGPSKKLQSFEASYITKSKE